MCTIIAKTRAVIEDVVVKSMVAQINLPMIFVGTVCARVAGGELEAVAKTVTVTVSISPTEVDAMFVVFDDDQPQVHDVGPSTEEHITSEMFVRTVQDFNVVSGTVIISVVRLRCRWRICHCFLFRGAVRIFGRLLLFRWNFRQSFLLLGVVKVVVKVKVKRNVA